MPDTHRHALKEGHRIEEYEIRHVLGVGGFGITYFAYDRRLDGPVALKEYFPAGIAVRASAGDVVVATSEEEHTFAWGLARFIDEARALHRLRHSNVLQVHRYLRANGTAYIVMEHVAGQSLAEVLDARRKLSVYEWQPWLGRLLDGLAHVHDQGYLHRDIKPANIVIRAEDSEPVLVDFGSARIAAAEKTHTQVLTPDYAPIEQHSTAMPQGPPADIYSVGAVSYRALTGKPPPAALDRLLGDQCEPLAEQTAPGFSAWLSAIDRSLSVRPEARPQTVREWRDELAAAWKRSAGDHQVPLQAGQRRQGWWSLVEDVSTSRIAAAVTAGAVSYLVTATLAVRNLTREYSSLPGDGQNSMEFLTLAGWTGGTLFSIWPVAPIVLAILGCRLRFGFGTLCGIQAVVQLVSHAVGGTIMWQALHLETEVARPYQSGQWIASEIGWSLATVAALGPVFAWWLRDTEASAAG